MNKIWESTTGRGNTNSCKTWPLWNKRKLLLCKIVQRNPSQKNETYWTNGQNTALNCTITRPTEIHQYWTAPRQTQRMTIPSPRKEVEAFSTITEEREVSWSRKHPSRTGPSRWTGSNHRSHGNLHQDLADRRMANPVDPVLSHYTPQERQPATVQELTNDQPHQPPKQSHAEDHAEQIETTSWEDNRWRTGRLQSRKEHYRADLQPTNPLWEISPAPTRPLPCLHRLQEGLRQGLACSFVGTMSPNTSMTRPPVHSSSTAA